VWVAPLAPLDGLCHRLPGGWSWTPISQRARAFARPSALCAICWARCAVRNRGACVTVFRTGVEGLPDLRNRHMRYEPRAWRHERQKLEPYGKFRRSKKSSTRASLSLLGALCNPRRESEAYCAPTEPSQSPISHPGSLQCPGALCGPLLGPGHRPPGATQPHPVPPSVTWWHPESP
jgi:hypothetical protein